MPQESMGDREMSSHWTERLSNAKLCEEKGLLRAAGFGGYEPDPSYTRRLLHHAFQTPYRNMGKAYGAFPSAYDMARRITRAQNRSLDLDVLRQVLSISLIKDYVAQPDLADSTLVVIGDGYSMFSLLALTEFSCPRILVINLPQVLAVDRYFANSTLREFLQQGVLSDLSISESHTNVGPPWNTELIFLPAERSGVISGLGRTIAVNIASFGEMNPSTIRKYFDQLRSNSRGEDPNDWTLLYTANRLQKVLPDGTQTQFEHYPWQANDRVILDEPCPWHQTFYTFRPPWLRRYDGKIQHRLVNLAPLDLISSGRLRPRISQHPGRPRKIIGHIRDQT